MFVLLVKLEFAIFDQLGRSSWVYFHVCVWYFCQTCCDRTERNDGFFTYVPVVCICVYVVRGQCLISARDLITAQLVSNVWESGGVKMRAVVADILSLEVAASTCKIMFSMSNLQVQWSSSTAHNSIHRYVCMCRRKSERMNSNLIGNF